MKKLILHLIGNTCYISPVSQSVLGAWIYGDQVVTIGMGDSDTLEAGVLESLSGSQVGVTHPTDWSTLIIPLLKASKRKSYRAFTKHAMMINVEENMGVWSFTPTRNLWPNGFEEILKESIVLEKAQKGEIAKAIHSTFDRCG